ncbi:MAG: VCBS repeat-containing protein [Proteobacteria bacterium]|nr:VCBS repeat-containing protein [Pseudomonadota bacterium]
MKRNKSNLISSLIALTFLLLTGIAGASEESQKPRVAFLPFEVHAAKDLSYLQDGVRVMLASRLAAGAGIQIIDKLQVDSAVAQPQSENMINAVAQAVKADYVVIGSITGLGGSVSLDAKVYKMPEPGAYESFFVTAAREEEIILAIDQLAWDIASKVFGAEPPVRKMRTTTADTSSQTTFQTAHPDRAFITPGGVPVPVITGTPAVPATPPTTVGAFGFTKTQNLKKVDLQAMDIGDVDGDGEQEIILAGKSRVHVYKLKGNNLQEMAKIDGNSQYKNISVSVEDLNGDGKAEIYICAADHKEPDSFAVEWDGDSFEHIYKDQKWYTKTMTVPGRGITLVGQQPGLPALFERAIYLLQVEGDGLVAGDTLAAPEALDLFDFSFADLDRDGEDEFVVLDSRSDRIMVLESNGGAVWSSSEYYGGVLRYIGGKDPLDFTDDKVARFYIPSRIIVTEVNNDGIVDVIVKKDSAESSRLMADSKQYPSGALHALSWNGISLATVWQTNKIDGYIADYQLREINGKKILFVGILLQEKGVFDSAISTVLMYPVN